MAKTSIKIGDKDYPYRLDFRAIRMAEQSLGSGILEQSNLAKTTYYMTVLWAGINRENTTVSYIDVEKAVDRAVGKKLMTFSKVQEFVLKQINSSGAVSGFGDEEEDEAAPLASASSSTSD